MNIGKNIASFMDQRGMADRYSSFDYCYNYFQSFRRSQRIAEVDSTKYIQMSCLQIGFYLASWGMLRGSSFLLQKSLKHYVKLIRLLPHLPATVWEIDVDKYSEDNITILLESTQRIAAALEIGDRRAPTLVTKTMLGIFGNIPAFDEYFCNGFGVRSLNKPSLETIALFYSTNKGAFEEKSHCCVPPIQPQFRPVNPT